MRHQTEKKSVKNICIDIDGVLADTRKGLADYCYEKLGVLINPSLLEKFKLREILEISKDKSNDLVSDFYNNGYGRFSPLPDSVEVVRKLSSFYTPYAVSGRPEYLEDGTKEWVHKIYHNSIKGILFAKAHDIKTPKNRPTKGEICEKLGAHFMVDDDSVYSLDCLNRGIHVLYLHGDHPLTNPRAIEVASWQDILRYATGGLQQKVA